MPTESFSLAEASPSYTGIVSNQKSGTRKSESVKDWSQALEAGGWTKRGELKPWMTVRINAAHLPVRSPEPPGGDDDKLDGAIVCTMAPAITVSSPAGTVSGMVWAWDPGVYTEPPCSNFALGGSPGTTFDNFKVALQEATGMLIISEGGDGDIAELTLEHTVAGPAFNGLLVGGWTGGQAWYGGYSYSSGTYRGRLLSVSGVEGPGWAGGEYHGFEFTARIHNGPLDLSGGTAQKFSLWLSRTHQYPWRICVCPYQFAIWMDQYGDGGAGAGGDTPYPRSALVSMPWVPEGYTGHSCFAFIATGILGVFRGDFSWGGHTWFNAGPWSAYEFFATMIPVLRTRGEVTTPDAPDRITTTQGLLLTDNAYVTASRDPARQFVIDQRIAGKLWNCCTVSDNYPFATVYSDMMDARWVHVSSHRYYPDYAASPFLYGMQKASLWWKVDAGDVVSPEA